MRNSNFSTYDPNYLEGGDATSAPGQKMQININIANPTAVNLQVELFSAIDSILNRKKAEFVNGAFTYTPRSSYEGAAAVNGAGTVYVDQDGNMIIKGAHGDPTLKVSCNEYAYANLLRATQQRGFTVSRLRLTVATDVQIDNNITHFQASIGGGKRENSISPRAFFQPNQYQGKTIDIDWQFAIDGYSGLTMQVNAGETIRLSLFVTM